jgi:hypothetical protein
VIAPLTSGGNITRMIRWIHEDCKHDLEHVATIEASVVLQRNETHARNETNATIPCLYSNRQVSDTSSGGTSQGCPDNRLLICHSVELHLQKPPLDNSLHSTTATTVSSCWHIFYHRPLKCLLQFETKMCRIHYQLNLCPVFERDSSRCTQDQR